MINFNEIIGPIEQAIIKWVQRYPLAVAVHTLEDLTNAEHFIYFLKKVPDFQFAESYPQSNFSKLALGQRISRMKMIGRSIITYYKRSMMKDIGQTRFNYSEMCTGNKEELIRLIIMFMGIIVTNNDTLQEIEDYINTSKQESIGYMKIMVDYAKKMLENEQETNDSPLKRQKRLITRLEILQEQVQYYEEYTRQLQGKVEQLGDEAEKNQKIIAEYLVRDIQMLKRIEQIQSNNEQLIKGISKKTANEEFLNAKLTKNRQLADEAMNKLLHDVDIAKQQTMYYKKLLQKYEQVDAINKQLSNTNNELMKQLQAIKSKYEKSIQNLHKKDIQLQLINRINNDLSLQNDGLKVRIQLIQKSFTNNRSIHFSPQQKSMVIHNPLSLSTTSNQHNFAWFNFKERQIDMNNEQRMGDSLTLTLKSNDSYYQNRPKGYQDNKQNEMNNANITYMPQQSHCDLNNIVEEKSFELDMDQVHTLMKFKQERDFQFDFSIQMITEIYDYMESIRKELKRYQLREANQMKRGLIFKQKVNTMFS